jgi:hypothetical protein
MRSTPPARVSPALLAAIAHATFAAAAARAQDQPPPAPWHADEAWTIRAEPSLAFTAMSGRLTLPRSSPGPSPELDLRALELDEPRFSPTAEVNLRKGRWRASVRALVFAAEHEGPAPFGYQVGDVSASTGDSVRASIDFTSIEIEGAYTLWAGRPGTGEHGDIPLRTRADAVVGVRLIDLATRVENLSTSTSQEADEQFAQIEVGLKGAIEVREEFTIDLQVALGGLPFASGDASSSAFDIIVGGSWKPWRHAGFQIGYRALFFGVGTGEGNELFDLTGASQGLYAGFVAEF